MTGLVLKLAPNERVLINGAVIENGNRRGRLNIVTPNAHILRLRDAIHPEKANTPVSRLCYSIQLVLSGDTSLADARPELLKGIEQLSRIFTDDDSRKLLGSATESVLNDQAYHVLKSLRSLLPREARLMAVAKE